jgi:FkbM family methyltransferase
MKFKTKTYGNDLYPEIMFYRSILPDLKTVVDVGCRCDNHFYDLNPELEIHLFEPMSTPDILAFADSIKNVPNIHFNNYGLSSKEEVKTFYLEYMSLSKDWHRYLDRGKSKVELNFRTLYDYVIENNIEKIDLLKLDTEAWDFEVMKGLKDKIWDVTYIQFEFGWPVYGESDTVEDIYNYFKGYNVYDIGGSPHNYVITKKTLNYPQIR